MKKYGIMALGLALLLLMGGCRSGANVPENAEVKLTVGIERYAEYRSAENGDIIAQMYYDMPVFYGEEAIVTAMNTFFEQEKDIFFDGKQKFFDSVADMRDIYGDIVLSESPLEYTVDTSVTYMGTDFVSVFNRSFWMAGGVNSYSYEGAVFDVSTGKRITPEAFVDIGIAEFNMRVEDLVKSTCSEYIPENELFELYSRIADNSFEDYNFIYNGKELTIIINEEPFENKGALIEYIGYVRHSIEQ